MNTPCAMVWGFSFRLQGWWWVDSIVHKFLLLRSFNSWNTHALRFYILRVFSDVYTPWSPRTTHNLGHSVSHRAWPRCLVWVSVFYDAADYLKINNSNIGIASKDLSLAKIKNLDIKNTKTCFVAFQKKPEYGPGYASIENILVENSKNKYVALNQSKIQIDGKILEQSKIDLAEYLN